jgi:hypothetical protein
LGQFVDFRKCKKLERWKFKRVDNFNQSELQAHSANRPAGFVVGKVPKMQNKPKIVLQCANQDGRQASFSGYWYRAPVEIDFLMDLKCTEIKVFMVINRAIERDQNQGLISMRQIRQRAKIKSLGHTQEAVNTLCELGIFARHNPATGVKLTDPKEWKGRSVEYCFTFQLKQKDAANRSPHGEQVINPAPSPTNCTPQGEQNSSPLREQHSESSEYKCSSVSVVVDSDVDNMHRQADSGHASQETDKGSLSVSCRRVNYNKGPGIGCTAAMVASEERKPTPIWTDSDVTNVGNGLAAFMDGEQPPAELLSWIIKFAEQDNLSAYDIRRALNAAWNRNGCPGRKNRPRSWKWFYEVLRAALRPGYAARLPEARSLNQFQQKKRHASRLPIQTPGGPI